MTGAPDARRHLPQLDGLRGIAVLLVLAEHFIYNPWIHSWSPGSVGVRTFFVLSGFLITGILLDDRDRFDQVTVARRFFRNRALRLLPAFALAVGLAAALGLGGMRQDWPWHLAYLSNVQVFLTGRWSAAGHFWTLAVEQQFYLLWFPVVVLLPRRRLLPMVLVLLVAALRFRWRLRWRVGFWSNGPLCGSSGGGARSRPWSCRNMTELPAKAGQYRHCSRMKW